MPDWIPREILHAIRCYYIEGTSSKGFREDEDTDLTSEDISTVLNWFNDVIADAIENN